MKLYAVWRRQIKFRYISNESTPATADISDQYYQYANGGNYRLNSAAADNANTSANVPAVPSKTGSAFGALGWRYDTTAGAKQVTANAAASGDITGGNTTTAGNANFYLYAVYSRTITASYANGGHGTIPASAPASQTQYVNAYAAGTYSSVQFALGTMSNVTGYTFQGWKYNGTNYAKNATTAAITPALSVTNCEFTGRWTTNTHTLKVTATNGTIKTVTSGGTDIKSAATGTSGTTVEYGKALVLEVTPSTGYHFSEWEMSATVSYTNSKTKSSNPTNCSMPDADLTANAKCVANTYTVAYINLKADGTEQAMGTSSHTYDTGKALTALSSLSNNTRAGYIFVGWTTSNTATHITYTDGQTGVKT